MKKNTYISAMDAV